MSTRCDIDDPASMNEDAGRNFAILLQQVAIEYGRLQNENTRLSAIIEDSLGKISRVTTLDKEVAMVSTNDICKGLSQHFHSSKAISLDDDVLAEKLEQHGSPDHTESVWTVAPSQPMVALPNAGSDLQNTQLHYLWTQSRETLAGMQNSTTRSLTSKFGVGPLRGCSCLKDDVCMQRFIMGPNDVMRMLWDLMSILVLSIDIVMVPLAAFDIPETLLLKNTSLICTSFWTFDIAASFLTGFYIEGAIEMRPKKVARSYLQSWFPFDLLVILFEWLLLVSTSGLADIVSLFRMSKMLRLARILRAIRLLRLLRMVKLPALLDDMADYMRLDCLATAFRVMRSLVTIGVANHFLACGWYAVGKASTPSWITELDDDGRDLSFRYATALHWSLTQFTPASMEIHPKGLPERVYSICVLFLALVVFSSFVSSITNAMNHLRQVNEVSSKQKSNLRRYIQENKLSAELGHRITAFAKQLRVQTRARVHEKEVEAFKVLPESLKLQLHWEVYVPILSRHSFFFHVAELFEPFLLELCGNAVNEKSLMTGQELFSQDDDSTEMYFLLSGSLAYYQGQVDIRTATVTQDQWCCEAALWLVWVHQGQLAALSHVEIVTFDATVFRKVVSRCIKLFEVCKVYALSFQEHVSCLSKNQSLDVYCDHDSALGMSHDAFEHVRQQRQDDVNDDFIAKSAWRTWHTLSLIRISTPPPLKGNSRSNTR